MHCKITLAGALCDEILKRYTVADDNILQPRYLPSLDHKNYSPHLQPPQLVGPGFRLQSIEKPMPEKDTVKGSASS